MEAAAEDHLGRCGAVGCADPWQGSRPWSPQACEGSQQSAHFTNIGGVDDAVPVPLLHDVVIGHASLQRLNDQCALVKARMKLQLAILSDVNVKQFDWDAAQKKFPLAWHDDFVERGAQADVRESIKARAALPGLFVQELDRRVKSDQQTEGRASTAAAVQVCININAGRLQRVGRHLILAM